VQSLIHRLANCKVVLEPGAGLIGLAVMDTAAALSDQIRENAEQNAAHLKRLSDNNDSLLRSVVGG
jgi:hypothetical protein